MPLTVNEHNAFQVKRVRLFLKQSVGDVADVLAGIRLTSDVQDSFLHIGEDLSKLLQKSLEVRSDNCFVLRISHTLREASVS